MRTILISEPHLYDSSLRFGAHHYANILAQNGWNVFFFSASFNLARLFLPKNKDIRRYMKIWKSKGVIDSKTGIINCCVAHVLPARLRYNRLFESMSSRLYVPQIGALLKSYGINELDVLWLNGNNDWLYRVAVRYDKLIVRIVDNYAGYGHKYSRYQRIMNDTLMSADCVVACSSYVRNLYCGVRDDIKVVPNGVEYELFSGQDYEQPDFLREIPRPRVLYVGAIAEWFDWELLYEVAKLKPDFNFIIVGPLKVEPSITIPRPRNIHTLGKQPYSEIPNIAAHSDIGIVPFRNCELVSGVSPIKIYEYLAAGLPVVSTWWRELEVEQLPILMAHNAQDFAKGLEIALAYSNQDKKNIQEYARTCSWEHRLNAILQYSGIQL